VLRQQQEAQEGLQERQRGAWKAQQQPFQV
jgi:hypothetical protein